MKLVQGVRWRSLAIKYLSTALMLFWSAEMFAASHVKRLSFNVDEWKECNAAAESCVPWEPELATFADENRPRIPQKTVHFLLPEGEGVSSVEWIPDEMVEMTLPISVAPVQRTISGFSVERHINSKAIGYPFPKAPRSEARVRSFRGYNIVTISIFPLQFIADNQAQVALSGTLTVQTSTAKGASPKVRNLRRDLAMAANLAGGADLKTGVVPPEGEVGYLIIGPRSLLGTSDDSPLLPLVREKESRHIQVFMDALEDVAPEKTPEAIREAIQKRFNEDNVDYVLLVGDHGHLPWKKIVSGVNDHSDPVPSDQYYACLDGTFDQGTTYDWDCEVAVGRIGVKTRDDIKNWVWKTLYLADRAYLNSAKKMLFYGEKLDGRTLGSRVLNYIIDGSDLAPTTSALPTLHQKFLLYDTFAETKSKEDFMAYAAEKEPLVINHLGHANYNYVLRMGLNDISDLQIPPTFIYSQGCYPNDPDRDNWTIKAVRAEQYGPAAMISNTRYGWYAPGSSGEGSSAKLHRAFWDMLFTKEIKKVGLMNHAAKAHVMASDSSALMKYTALESNLIGDPELDLGFR